MPLPLSKLNRDKALKENGQSLPNKIQNQIKNVSAWNDNFIIAAVFQSDFQYQVSTYLHGKHFSQNYNGI